MTRRKKTPTPEGNIRRLSPHLGFEIIATRQSNGWWRVTAIRDVKDSGKSSADRTALVVQDPLLEVAEKTARERINRLRGVSS
jgi:hypothetical protein